MGAEITANPAPVLARLRALGAVVWHETYRRWLVTTDRDIRKLVIDNKSFTVEDTTVATLFGTEAFISIDDRRRHDQLRNIWVDAFRPPMLDALYPAAQSIVDKLLAEPVEKLRDGLHVDLAAALCRPLPTMIIALMMGVPDDMLGDIVRWSDAMAGGGSTYLRGEAARLARQSSDDGKDALASYLLVLMEERRTKPGGDLVSMLVTAEAARNLPDEHLVQNLRQLLFAGNETTAKWLGHLFVNYAERPDVRRELTADPALIAAANDEVMRWESVVGTLVRRVRGGPLTVGGVTLPDGADLTLLLASANRDPARYAEPDSFDIHRPALPNLGFGIGLHNCLGSVLAKMEAGIAVGSLLREVPDFCVAGPYHYTPLPLRGPLPVTIALAN